jgi:hypothetical protein
MLSSSATATRRRATGAKTALNVSGLLNGLCSEGQPATRPFVALVAMTSALAFNALDCTPPAEALETASLQVQ